MQFIKINHHKFSHTASHGRIMLFRGAIQFVWKTRLVFFKTYTFFLFVVVVVVFCFIFREESSQEKNLEEIHYLQCSTWYIYYLECSTFLLPQVLNSFILSTPLINSGTQLIILSSRLSTVSTWLSNHI